MNKSYDVYMCRTDNDWRNVILSSVGTNYWNISSSLYLALKKSVRLGYNGFVKLDKFGIVTSVEILKK